MYIKDAKNDSVSKILTLGVFSIPDFQRGYSWDEDNINEFYEDIFGLSTDDPFFLGAIILNYPDSKHEKDFKIIDWQQRITTITTCLCAFRDVVFKNQSTIDPDIYKLAETINESYIYFKDTTNFWQETPILQSDNLYPIFQNSIQAYWTEKDSSIKKPVEDGEKLLIDAYNFFIKKFEDLITVKDKKSINKIMQKLLDTQMVYVKVEWNAEDANTVFNVLNSRWKELYVWDFLKSEIFRKYPKGSTNTKNKAKLWKEIENNISYDRKQFFNYFYASNFWKISDINLPRKYSELVKGHTENNIKDFLKLLHEYSWSYSILTKVKYGWKKDYLSINEYIKILFNLNIEQPRILLLSIMFIHGKNLKLINVKDFEAILEKILNFHVFFSTVMSLRPSWLDKMYSSTSVEILRIFNSSGTKKSILSELDKLYLKLDKKLKDNITLQLFKDKILDKSFSKDKYKSVDKTMFFYLLYLNEKGCNPWRKVTDDMTLEHFYPEWENNTWAKLSIDSLKYSLWNIFLLEDYLNKDVKADKFLDKKEKIVTWKRWTYNPTNMISTYNYIKPLYKWDQDDIFKRTDSLSEFLYTTFISK